MTQSGIDFRKWGGRIEANSKDYKNATSLKNSKAPQTLSKSAVLDCHAREDFEKLDPTAKRIAADQEKKEKSKTQRVNFTCSHQFQSSPQFPDPRTRVFYRTSCASIV